MVVAADKNGTFMFLLSSSMYLKIPSLLLGGLLV